MSADGKYYGRVYITEEVTTEKLASIVEKNCSIKASDVRAVLRETFDVLKDKLQSGAKVTLNGIGSFKVGVSTTGVEDVADFSVSNVRKKHIIYTPERTWKSITLSDGTVTKTAFTDLLDGIEFKVVSLSAGELAALQTKANESSDTDESSE